MTKYRLCLLVTLTFAICSCGKRPFRQELALSAAGDNAAEIEKVLDYFDDDDTRRKAAKYTVENMLGKFSLDSASVSGNEMFYEALIEYRSSHSGSYGFTGLYDVCDSMEMLYGKPEIAPGYTLDLKTLSSEILISHIDNAVSTWESSPWKDEVSFGDFCRYVLPYQVQPKWWPGAEDYLRNKYADSMNVWSEKGKLAAAEKLKSAIESSFRQDGTFFLNHDYMGTARFENTVKAQAGVCYDFNTTLVTALRAFGIPAAINTVPYWGNSNASHFWAEIIGVPSKGIYDNTQLDFHSIEEEIVNDTFWFKDYVIKDTTGIPPCVKLRKTRTVPKIYRLGFEVNKHSLPLISREEIPALFQDPTLEDITSSSVSVKDVRVLIDKRCGKKYAYLCCYEPNSAFWSPVAWGKVRPHSIVFKDMGVNVVYLAAYYIDGMLVPIGDPFLLLPSGQKKYFTSDFSANESATLLSKVPLRTNFAFYASTMKGDKIYSATRPDFSDSSLVYSIDSIPFYTQERALPEPVESRYMIYKTDSSEMKFIAELEFWGRDVNGAFVKFSGKPFGNKCYSTSSLEDAFDGNRESSAFLDKFGGKEDYIGYDFGCVRRVEKIVYCPRNDDNAIIPGDDYELFCWNEGWYSLGHQRGGADRRLHYDNIPKNALLRLHNHSRGVENRIFTIEDGAQVWW